MTPASLNRLVDESKDTGNLDALFAIGTFRAGKQLEPLDIEALEDAAASATEAEHVTV